MDRNHFPVERPCSTELESWPGSSSNEHHDEFPVCNTIYPIVQSNEHYPNYLSLSLSLPSRSSNDGVSVLFKRALVAFNQGFKSANFSFLDLLPRAQNRSYNATSMPDKLAYVQVIIQDDQTTYGWHKTLFLLTSPSSFRTTPIP